MMKKKKPLKILNIIQRYYPAKGGAELFVKTISEYAVKLGHDVDVWTSDAFSPEAMWDLNGDVIEKKDEIVNRVNVLRFKMGGMFQSPLLNKLFRVTFQNLGLFRLSNIASCPNTYGMLRKARSRKLKKYDVVFASSTPYFILLYVGYIISRRLKIPYWIAPALHTGLENDDKLRKKYLKKTSIPFYQHASKIFINTKAEAKAIENFCKENSVVLEKEKFVLIGQGVFLDEVTSGNGEAFKRRYNLNSPIVFQVGHKTEDKGSYNLIKAMKLLWDKGVEAHLIFAGLRSDDFTRFLHKQNKKYKKWILNIDNISDEEKWDLFSAGDIFSMISKTDSFGIVYLEAWSNNVPVIGCNNKAIKQVISYDKDGFLLDFDDIQGISRKIEYLLNDKSERERMGRNDRMKVLRKYDWKKNLNKLGKFYQNI